MYYILDFAVTPFKHYSTNNIDVIVYVLHCSLWYVYTHSKYRYFNDATKM